MNRCIKCNKFKKWKELFVSRFTPDTPFGPEETEYTCGTCDPIGLKSHNNWKMDIED